MRWIPILALTPLAACSASEPEIYKASANVDDASIAALMTAIDAKTDNDLDIAGIVEFVAAVPMDDELQHRLAVTVEGEEAELAVHYWREQADWVHVYASSPSQVAIAIFEEVAAQFARAPD